MNWPLRGPYLQLVYLDQPERLGSDPGHRSCNGHGESREGTSYVPLLQGGDLLCFALHEAALKAPNAHVGLSL